MNSKRQGSDDLYEAARLEEKISKQKALGLFETALLKNLEAGSFAALAGIHRHLFGELYDFAGKLRDVNIAKGAFRFVPCIYLAEALKKISAMSQSNFVEHERAGCQLSLRRLCRL